MLTRNMPGQLPGRALLRSVALVVVPLVNACLPRASPSLPPPKARVCEVVGTLEPKQNIGVQMQLAANGLGQRRAALVATDHAILLCPCLAEPALASSSEATRLGARTEETQIGMAEEASRIDGTSESFRTGAGQEEALLGAGNESASVRGANESARLAGEDDQARLGSADESARLAAAYEPSRIDGADESSRVAGQTEAARIGGTGQEFRCRANESFLGMTLVGPGESSLRWLFDGGVLWDLKTFEQKPW